MKAHINIKSHDCTSKHWGITKHELYLNWGSQHAKSPTPHPSLSPLSCSVILVQLLLRPFIAGWRKVHFAWSSVHDECLHMKTLCQPIWNTRHTDDATQFVVLRPTRYAHISISVLFAFCVRKAVLLCRYNSNASLPTFGRHDMHPQLYMIVTKIPNGAVCTWYLREHDRNVSN